MMNDHDDLILKTVMLSTGDEAGLDDFIKLQEIADLLMRSINSFISNISRNLADSDIVNSALVDLLKFMFGEFPDYTISINGYDELKEHKYSVIKNRTVYNSISIRSTQGDIYTLDDYFRSCICRWEKVK